MSEQRMLEWEELTLEQKVERLNDKCSYIARRLESLIEHLNLEEGGKP